ncbi:MAG: hypothetical protein AB7F74_22640 [Parvibaculaceae bacterium]
MLTLGRLFVNLLFGAVLLISSGVASMADVGGHAAIETSWIDTQAAEDSEELRAAIPADCEGRGGSTCCTQACGMASCAIGGLAVPSAHVFAFSTRSQFLRLHGRMLSQRTLVGLLRPPKADLV